MSAAYVAVCADCGMTVMSAAEYHPYAACLMFKACQNGDTVRANLVEPQRGKEVAAFRTSKQTMIRVIAEGEWSGRDIEGLYELIGHGLRNGPYDETTGGKS